MHSNPRHLKTKTHMPINLYWWRGHSFETKGKIRDVGNNEIVGPLSHTNLYNL